ncbi:MAG: hypothetical protein QOD68_244 [Actinomycetota bacterium]|nr:hypothetical protein [Actinomycetota bacterium]
MEGVHQGVDVLQAPSAWVPSLNTVKPSPPVARKLFKVARNESVGCTSTPLTHILPTFLRS